MKLTLLSALAVNKYK